MYYYGGYSGGYNTGSCGCNNTMNYSYPSYGYVPFFSYSLYLLYLG